MSEDRPYQGLDSFSHPRDHSSRVVPLWVNGSPPFELSVSERTLAFGGQMVNDDSDARPIILTNTGFKPLTIVSVQISNKAFLLTSPFKPLVLEAGKIMVLPVKFLPTEFGLMSGTLTVTTKEAGTKKVRLIGEGIWNYIARVDEAIDGLWGFLRRATRPALTTTGPVLSLSNTSYLVPDELPVDGSVEFTYTIYNAGNQNLLLDNLQVSGDFTLVSV